MILVGHVILQDHMIKESYDYIGSRYITILTTLVAIGTVTVKM